jgi:hypothetical protein
MAGMQASEKAGRAQELTARKLTGSSHLTASGRQYTFHVPAAREFALQISRLRSETAKVTMTRSAPSISGARARTPRAS